MTRTRFLPRAGRAIGARHGDPRQYGACCPQGVAHLPDQRDIALFVYGSLELAEVMRCVTGHEFRARPATLPGHRRRIIRGEVYPGMVADEHTSVRGVLYEELTEDDLDSLDLFEGEPYQRERVSVVCAGAAVEAFTYVLRSEHARLLTEVAWDRDLFRDRHLSEFLDRWREFRSKLCSGLAGPA
ncbi:MAG: gamma-glutamylcyclotransferase [Deltaproteobacteria bacterium]|nr:gamma-glutamylcyclotransferase [Deltaproteobacteria bacterium]MBW2694988.1 gamma-glutamylcyclotransferase [Deltaproteobacteria bacterium]